ncbi:MAG: hypothetical protein LBN30_04135 [Oscillospiraceae bacterium]|jgi:hypothetical protein|nr:hypothetical protein [Oscillospiraceae bacterium]
MTTTGDLILWFDERLEASRERAAWLRADSRGDDAVLESVRGNVFRMFGAMFQVAARLGENEPEPSRLLFMDRAEPFTAKWADAREKAETHGDAKTAVTERLKSDTLAEIFARVDALGRDGT